MGTDRVRAAILCTLALAMGQSPAPSTPLDVRMQLVPSTILLGEPIWVDVAVTNRSSDTVRVDMGNSCFGSKEINISIPAAEQRRIQTKHCGVPGGSCAVPGPFAIQPGETLKRRYVLSGDFRIVRPGIYTVLVDKDFPYGSNAPQHVTASLNLDVLPADPAKLLEIERRLAQEAAAPSAEWYIAAGLVAYPTPGMEPVFASWLAQNDFLADWSITALSHLNTLESREILTRQAASSDLPREVNFQIHRWEAIVALAGMRDVSAVPLLEKLTQDPYHDVQRAAVEAIGKLGGAQVLPFLYARARSSRTMFDRQDAIQAMGDTGTLGAVPLLIELFTLPDSDQPVASESALETLTHHDLPEVNRLRTPLQSQKEWRDWWAQNRTTAVAYRPCDC